MKDRIFISIIFAFFLHLPVWASPALEEAAASYEAKDYEKAVGLYRGVMEEQGVSAPLLYNLGNSYFQLSDFANAMLCYERAYRLDPSSSEIRENLIYLKNKVEDANRAEQRGKKLRIEEDEPTFFQTLHKAITEEVHSDRWAVWGVIAFFLFLLCVGIYVFTKSVLLRKIGFFGGFVVLGVNIICIIFGFLAAMEFNRHETGIITAYKISLQTEPGEKNANTKEGNNILTRGTKVRVVAEETDASGNVSWYKVRLNADYIGWVQAEDLEMI